MAILSLSSCHHGTLAGESMHWSRPWKARPRKVLPSLSSHQAAATTMGTITNTARTSSNGKKEGARKKMNPRDPFTFSYQFNTEIPLHETPGASIDDYLQNRSRVVGVVFPDRRKRTKLNDEEWSIQLVPIQFLFLTASPVIIMRVVSISNGKEYPPTVPRHTTTMLQMEATECRLHGLDSFATPPHLALNVRGMLYPHREGKKGLKVKGHVEMSVGFNLPPVLALVPEGVIRGIGEAALRQLAEQMKEGLNAGLATDFKKYRGEKLTENETGISK